MLSDEKALREKSSKITKSTSFKKFIFKSLYSLAEPKNLLQFSRVLLPSPKTALALKPLRAV